MTKKFDKWNIIVDRHMDDVKMNRHLFFSGTETMADKSENKVKAVRAYISETMP